MSKGLKERAQLKKKERQEEAAAARRLLKEKEEALQAAEEQRRLEQVGNTRSGFTISTWVTISRVQELLLVDESLSVQEIQ